MITVCAKATLSNLAIMAENQITGYESTNPSWGGQGFILSAGAAGGCYYEDSNIASLETIGIYPDGSEYKIDMAELRQYLLNLENTRRIEDLSDVNFGRSPQPGDALLYDHTTGNWELSNYISGGEW